MRRIAATMSACTATGVAAVRAENPTASGPAHGLFATVASPAGAAVVARTAAAQQAYTIGRSMGVQFHPELTPSMLQGWFDNGGAAYLEEHGQDADQLMARTVAIAADAEARLGKYVAAEGEGEGEGTVEMVFGLDFLFFAWVPCHGLACLQPQGRGR